MSDNSNRQLSLGMNAVYKMILNVFNLLVPLLVGPYIAGLLDKELYGIVWNLQPSVCGI